MNVTPLTGTPAAATPAPLTGESKKLHDACTQMEAFIWSYVMRQAPSTGKPGPFQDGAGTRTFRDLLDTERASQMAKTSTNGLGEMLYRELSHKMAAQSIQKGTTP